MIYKNLPKSVQKCLNQRTQLYNSKSIQLCVYTSDECACAWRGLKRKARCGGTDEKRGLKTDVHVSTKNKHMSYGRESIKH